jgi:formate C-acetyltransferase
MSEASLESRRRRALYIGDHRSHSRKQLLFARGLREAPDASPNVRRAHAVAHCLEYYPVMIGPDDRLLGSVAYDDELTDAESAELEELLPWVGRMHEGLPYGAGGITGGHRTVDYQLLLREGIEGRLEAVARRRREIASDDPDRRRSLEFCQACEICLRGVLSFAERYSQAAAELAGEASDPHERGRWENLSRLLRRVPAGPASSFHEALQAVWLVQVALTFDDPSSTGRPDAYLYPFYRADIRRGVLDSDGALELISELYLRSNEVFGDWPETILLGGLDARGQRVENELTRLFLRAVQRVGLVNPNVGVCYRPEMSGDLLELCVDLIARGLSHPALFNDRLIIRGLREAGLDEADARGYINSTCVEITPIGTSNVQVARVGIYPAKAIEILLAGGRETVTDARFLARDVPPERRGHWARPLEAGGLRADLDALKTFADFQDAYARVVGELVDQAVATARQTERVQLDKGAAPLVSCFTHDCLTRGLDATSGGARHNYWGTLVAGFSTAVDSLAAIRYVVYERRQIGLGELASVLASDFRDAPELAETLAARCPRYGSDEPKADDLARWLYDLLRDRLARHRTLQDEGYYLGVFSGWGGRVDGRRVSANVSRGLGTGATPDGRRASEPLSENIGPAHGSDRKGITALLHSVTTMDQSSGLGGTSLNLRLSRQMLYSEAGRMRTCCLLREAMAMGVFELQMNVVDTRMLIEARDDPQRHPTLMVRVAGYSDYFSRVGPEQQEDIIRRAEYDEAGFGPGPGR